MCMYIVPLPEINLKLRQAHRGLITVLTIRLLTWRAASEPTLSVLDMRLAKQLRMCEQGDQHLYYSYSFASKVNW
jgi:hypothetical protein